MTPPGRGTTLASRPAVFVGHDIYRQAAYGTLHPLAIPRVESVVDLCSALDWLPAGEYCVSPCASEAELHAFHDPDYVDALRTASERGAVDMQMRERYAIGTMENPLFPGLFERASTSVGGSIKAAELALEGHVAFHPAGGTHHGRPGRASGFCYFNDPVFALRRLLGAGLSRVLYVDLDAHHGDGVEDAFSADERVFMLSLHEAGRWPYTGAVDDGNARTCNIPVPARFHDRELALVVHDVVLPFAAACRPQAIVVTCGGDALAGDPLTSMALTNVALWDTVVRLVACAPVAVVLGGGGYNPWTLTRYWSGLWARLSGRAIPEALPAQARTVLSRLHCQLIDDDEVQPQWLATLADAPDDAPVRDELRALCNRLRRRVAETALTEKETTQ
ncbi:MAG: acetoin utilization protein AcuC [Rudaea sp.]